MLRRILVCTDGSKLSALALKQALGLAKALRARVSVLHVIPPFHRFTYRAQMLLSYRTALDEDTETGYRSATLREAKRILDAAQRLATAAGVPCRTLHAADDKPYRAIIEAAKKGRCGLIAMGSHGHGGLESVLLGSETQKVLVHADIPVLVCR